MESRRANPAGCHHGHVRTPIAKDRLKHLKRLNIKVVAGPAFTLPAIEGQRTGQCGNAGIYR